MEYKKITDYFFSKNWKKSIYIDSIVGFSFYEKIADNYPVTTIRVLTGSGDMWFDENEGAVELYNILLTKFKNE